jgi:hypothetical protein
VWNQAIFPALVALALLPHPAQAQLLDTLLPGTIPGYGQKFSVVAQHRQFAPGATGWNVDGITAAPSVNLQTGYDSAPGGSSASTTAQAIPSLLLTDPVAGFGLYAEANAAAYPQDAAQNTCTALLAGGERITLPRETITLSAALLHGAATGFAFDTAAITSPIPFTLKNLRASDEISSGLFTLTPEFSLSRYDFAGSASSANRTEQQEAATLDFVSGGPVTAILQIGATQLNYSLETQNADIYELLTGAQDKQDGLWTLSFLAGAAWRNPRIGPGLVAPIAEARADWQPTMLDKITLTASHEIDDPDAISASPYTRTSINLVISHEYLENVTVQALTDIAIAQYVHMDLHEFLGTGELDMQWRATPALALNGVYIFNTRQANEISAANENVVMLGLTWTP